MLNNKFKQAEADGASQRPLQCSLRVGGYTFLEATMHSASMGEGDKENFEGFAEFFRNCFISPLVCKRTTMLL